MRLRTRRPGYLGRVEPGAEVLPGYEVVRLLTHGRRMDTYDAYSTERDCRCIVKILRVDRLHEERVRAAVLREGHIVTSLAHPHLVRGYEVVEDPAPAVVLETLTGATLGAVIEEGPLEVADSAQLGLHLVSVLGYLHRQGWLHLDLKPANVVVEHGRAVLIDLSLADRPGQGRPGAGTRGYIAPEQATGTGLGPATDVWGLGVTLVECLTGELPYGDEATWGSRRRWPVVHRPAPTSPADLPDSVPPAYRTLLRSCLEHDPAARPRLSDVRAVLTDLAPPVVDPDHSTTRR